MSEAVALPMAMFPLGAVLFPHAPLGLHVFEERYQVLVQDCLQHGHEFGVVLIERGQEVGGGDSRYAVGTVDRILEAVPLPDGRWALSCVGDRRIRVTVWLPDDPYPLALVEAWPEERLEGRPEVLEEAERAVRRALALAGELGEKVVTATVALAEDPHVAAYQLAAIAPIGPFDQQRLLEAVGPLERLEMLADLGREVGDVLAFRLSAR